MSDRTLKFILMSYVLLCGALLQLTSCSFEAWRAPMALPAAVPDTIRLSAFPGAGKVKFNGPVNITLQQGTGNVATPTATDNTKAAKKADAAAIGAGATATSTPAGAPWWGYGIVLVVGAGVGLWVRTWVMSILRGLA